MRHSLASSAYMRNRSGGRAPVFAKVALTAANGMRLAAEHLFRVDRTVLTDDHIRTRYQSVRLSDASFLRHSQPWGSDTALFWT